MTPSCFTSGSERVSAQLTQTLASCSRPVLSSPSPASVIPATKELPDSHEGRMSVDETPARSRKVTFATPLARYKSPTPQLSDDDSSDFSDEDSDSSDMDTCDYEEQLKAKKDQLEQLGKQARILKKQLVRAKQCDFLRTDCGEEKVKEWFFSDAGIESLIPESAPKERPPMVSEDWWRCFQKAIKLHQKDIPKDRVTDQAVVDWLARNDDNIEPDALTLPDNLSDGEKEKMYERLWQWIGSSFTRWHLPFWLHKEEERIIQRYSDFGDAFPRRRKLSPQEVYDYSPELFDYFVNRETYMGLLLDSGRYTEGQIEWIRDNVKFYQYKFRLTDKQLKAFKQQQVKEGIKPQKAHRIDASVLKGIGNVSLFKKRLATLLIVANKNHSALKAHHWHELFYAYQYFCQQGYSLEQMAQLFRTLDPRGAWDERCILRKLLVNKGVYRIGPKASSLGFEERYYSLRLKKLLVLARAHPSLFSARHLREIQNAISGYLKSGRQELFAEYCRIQDPAGNWKMTEVVCPKAELPEARAVLYPQMHPVPKLALYSDWKPPEKPPEKPPVEKDKEAVREEAFMKVLSLEPVQPGDEEETTVENSDDNHSG